MNRGGYYEEELRSGIGYRVLRQGEVLLSQGKSITELCRQLGISDATYYKWRKVYGGLKVDQARKLKELERENARLK